ncbi:MAG: ribosome-binding factor A [Alphaproteobacteria bacterium]|nr:ribosome-binding factor A [Alphaproteobacteria bacterium]
MRNVKSDSNRPARIAAKVQQIVAEILRDNYADDATLDGVSIVGADAHGAGQFVKLYYYVRGGENAAVTARLGDITRSVRYELAARMNQKYVPEIRFVYDDTLERAQRIEDLLNNLTEK